MKGVSIDLVRDRSMGNYPPLYGAGWTQANILTEVHLFLIVTCVFCKLTDS